MSKDARKKQFREISLPSSLLSYAQINVALMPEAGAHAGVLDGQVLLVEDVGHAVRAQHTNNPVRNDSILDSFH